MGKIDEALKGLFGDPAAFADLFNAEFPWTTPIKPDQLRPWTTEYVQTILGKNQALLFAVSIRDLAYAIMDDGYRVYCVLGSEFEIALDRTVSARIAYRDILTIIAFIDAIVRANRRRDKEARQAAKASAQGNTENAENKENKDGDTQSTTAGESSDLGMLSREDYLRGFTENDKIPPVVTLVVYTGTKGLPGPVPDIHSIVDFRGDDFLRECMINFRPRVVSFCDLQDDKIQKYQGTLHDFAKALSICRNKSNLEIQKDLRNNPFFQSLTDPGVKALLRAVLRLAIPKGKGEENTSFGEEASEMLEDTREETEVGMCAKIAALSAAMQKDGRVKEFLAAFQNIDTIRTLFLEYGIVDQTEEPDAD